MTHRSRITAMALLISVVSGAGGCGESPLEAYDSAEVAYLRSQAEQQQADIDDGVLVETLEFRKDCRTVQAYVNALARGTVDEDDAAWQAFARVPGRFEDRGMGYMAEFFRGVVAAARRGDPNPAVEFLGGNCQDAPGAPGGIDGVDR